MTGMDVPIPKMEGRTAPYGVLITIGINVKKKSANIVGQKAIEKLTPIKKEPNFPFLILKVGILSNKRAKSRNCISPNKKRPIRNKHWTH